MDAEGLFPLVGITKPSRDSFRVSSCCLEMRRNFSQGVVNVCNSLPLKAVKLVLLIIYKVVWGEVGAKTRSVVIFLHQ